MTCTSVRLVVRYGNETIPKAGENELSVFKCIIVVGTGKHSTENGVAFGG